MKSFLCILPLFFVLLTGCQSIKDTVNNQDPVQLVAENSANIRSVSELVTEYTLSNVKREERVEVARYAYSVALGINNFAATGAVQREDLSKLSTQLLSNVNTKYRVVVGVLVAYLEGVVVDKVNSSLSSLSEDDKVVAFKTFLLAASEGVKTASLIYTDGVPDGSFLGARPEYFEGNIQVPVIVWQ